jgi:hypothetical protein
VIVASPLARRVQLPPHLVPAPEQVVHTNLGLLGVAAGVIGFAVFMLLAWVTLSRWREASLGGKLTRFTVASPDSSTITRLNVSPDGRSVAFVAGGRIHVRSFDSSVTRALDGTEGSGTPFWSPDSRYLAFPAAGKLKLIETAGGPTRIVAEVNTNLGGSWSDDGTILSGLVGDGLYRVASSGGPLTRLTELNLVRGESRHLMPQFLPGGRRFLLSLSRKGWRDQLPMPWSEPANTRPSSLESNVVFVPSKTDRLKGRLVFLRGHVLMAQPFDAGKLRVDGEAFPIAESVIANNAIGAAVTIGEFSPADGKLAYRRLLNRTTLHVCFKQYQST